MSGGWDAMISHEVAQLPTPDLLWAFEDWKTTRSYAYYGPAVRTAFIAGAGWVIARLGEWESLTEREAIEELRKGAQSVFHPLFAADPHVILDCPVDGRVSVGVEGYCDQCTYDWTV